MYAYPSAFNAASHNLLHDILVLGGRIAASIRLLLALFAARLWLALAHLCFTMSILQGLQICNELKFAPKQNCIILMGRPIIPSIQSQAITKLIRMLGNVQIQIAHKCRTRRACLQVEQFFASPTQIQNNLPFSRNSSIGDRSASAELQLQQPGLACDFRKMKLESLRKLSLEKTAKMPTTTARRWFGSILFDAERSWFFACLWRLLALIRFTHNSLITVRGTRTANSCWSWRLWMGWMNECGARENGESDEST